MPTGPDEDLALRNASLADHEPPRADLTRNECPQIAGKGGRRGAVLRFAFSGGFR